MSNEVLLSATLFFAALAAGISIYLLVEWKKFKTEMAEKPVINPEGMKLKLQAIERLTLFAERCGLKNLVTRTDISNTTTAELHDLLISSIKEEYDYNISQQAYVSTEIWNGVTKMKDQNIYVINQITANLPPQASPTDLCKLIIEYSMTPNAELSVFVLDGLQYEAKQILQ